MSAKSKAVDENQLSFLHILDADESTYVAKYEESYEFRFGKTIAYEMIRDSLYVLQFNRSNIQQRKDEMLWILSDENQEDICSFTQCCVTCGLDPFEVRMGIMHKWKVNLAEKLKISQGKPSPKQKAVNSFIDGELEGFNMYTKAFYHIYPEQKARSPKTKH